MSGYIYNNNIKFKSYGIFMVHAAGFLAGKIMRGGGFGVIINLILGIAGGVLGGWVFGLLGIAASGTTPYVIGAMHEARKNGILTGCITSNPNSPMATEADIPIEMIVGPEYVTGSSRMKSGTGQKMILNMISTAVMIGLGRVKGNKMVNMQLTNQKLIDRGTRMLIDELHLNYGEAQSLLLLHGSVEKAIEAFHNEDELT